MNSTLTLCVSYIHIHIHAIKQEISVAKHGGSVAVTSFTSLGCEIESVKNMKILCCTVCCMAVSVSLCLVVDFIFINLQEF